MMIASAWLWWFEITTAGLLAQIFSSPITLILRPTSALARSAQSEIMALRPSFFEPLNPQTPRPITAEPTREP